MSTTLATAPISQPAAAPHGFAALSPERRREIASQGGKASHRGRTGHEWNREAAREAGRKGGLATALAARQRAQTAGGTGSSPGR